MKPITVWKVREKLKDDSFVFTHNHIEDGHIESDIPTITFPHQKGWKSQTWLKEHRHLDDRNVVI